MLQKKIPSQMFWKSVTTKHSWTYVNMLILALMSLPPHIFTRSPC